MSSALHLLVLAKSPEPGRVKTRLCPPLSPAEAAAVAAAALADTLEAVHGCGADRKILALDGRPGPWLPPGFEVIEQRGTGLAERLANAWVTAGGGGVQIGMATPPIGAATPDCLVGQIDGPGQPAVLGPASDGGWWAIGWQRARPGPRAVFAGIPTSAPDTGARQQRRLLALGFDVTLARTERDIDTSDDLLTVAAHAPATRTAGVAARLGALDRVAS